MAIKTTVAIAKLETRSPRELGLTRLPLHANSRRCRRRRFTFPLAQFQPRSRSRRGPDLRQRNGTATAAAAPQGRCAGGAHHDHRAATQGKCVGGRWSMPPAVGLHVHRHHHMLARRALANVRNTTITVTNQSLELYTPSPYTGPQLPTSCWPNMETPPSPSQPHATFATRHRQLPFTPTPTYRP